MKRIVHALGKLSWRKRACAVVALCATTAIALPAQTFTTLHSFDGTDGAYPSSLVQASNGNLYGTTSSIGANHDGGTIFKITPTGALTTLYSFCLQASCPDGQSSYAGLVQATNGDFYGTTVYGGANGYGTVFKITPSGTLTTLHSFCSQSGCPDGQYPYAALVQAANGNIYGTTQTGGVNGPYGTIFKITPSGTLTTLYSFCYQSACTDGISPAAGLVQASNGDLYGTTYAGGANGNFDGTVFKITPSGTLTTLYSFCSQSECTDGAHPEGGLVQAADGNFYGTTQLGGANGGYGTVFKVTPSGALTTLYSFCSQTGCTDGSAPAAGLLQATNGDFYGTTYNGGASVSVDCANGCGTVFKITPSGALTTLYSFCAQTGWCTDGDHPATGLVQDTNGTFYGTATYGGGADGYGTVFSLSVGLGPFVKTQPLGGNAGTAVRILGSNLTGATRVTFNGIAAAFTVVSRYLITTTVPAGASNGKVEVVTPSRTLSSNLAFWVP